MTTIITLLMSFSGLLITPEFKSSNELIQLANTQIVDEGTGGWDEE